MKYLLLPFHLLKFWYIESLFFFGRTWKNLILYLEEDLAVGLMFRLLFVPLFHDSSIVGRILSFIFRTLRILIGLFAFALATVVILTLAILWLLLPIGVIREFGGIWGVIILLSGIGLFVIHIITHPHKTVWQAKYPWSASWIKKEKLNYQKLLQDNDVVTLLSYLESTTDQFTQFGFLNIEHILEEAFKLAKKNQNKYIEPIHFFVATIKLTPGIENYLLKLNLELEDFEKALEFLEKKENKWRLVYLWDSDFAIHHLKGINRGWLGVPTPVLNSVTEDVTKLASIHEYPDFIGRSFVVTAVINLLSEEGKRNVVLVGSPGSGKSALINYLAKLILAGDAPPALATKRLVRLDSTRFLSGMKTQGDLADRVKLIFDEVAFAGNVILVVEEIHNLGIGEAGTSMNLYSLMLPYLESSGFQFIATTEQENYTKILEKQGSFARLFIKVELPPATVEQTVEILEDEAIDIERRKKLRVSFLSLKKMAELSQKLIHDRVLPDSALEILDEVVSRQGNALEAKGWITVKAVEDVLQERINVPVMELGSTGKEKLLNLENELHQKLIDQEEAVKAVADSLRRSATGIREFARPIGSFLFVGPTGVGKTELAKTLSEVYFKEKGAFVRFDMSEYQSPDSVNKLIGASGEAGQLTEAVRNKQYCLLLLDEFEKADQKVLTVFLQVLEDGRLTDGEGKTVDFTNTIIIATSNVASLTIANGLQNGQSLESLEKQVEQELLEIFKPELINRFDSVVLFKPLSDSDLEKVVRLKLDSLKNQMREQGYLVEFDEQLVIELGKRGFDPVLGARPLRRLIQGTLESNLSKMILEGKLQKGETFKIGVKFL